MKFLLKLLLLLVIPLFTVFAQSQQDVLKQLNDINLRVDSLEKSQLSLIEKADKLFNQLNEKIESNSQNIDKSFSSVSSSLEKSSSSLNEKIKNSKDSTFSQISKIDESLDKSTLYWIIGFLIVSLSSVIAFVLINKKVSLQSLTLSEKILKTKQELEAEVIKIDSKTLEIVEAQLALLKNTSLSVPKINSEVDHSLALKVADEIVRIQRNLSHMDSNTKGLKQLSAAVERIRDNFQANGYEIVEMLNKEYNEGMRVNANIIMVENLDPSQRIISRIIKPQVNYNGIMIQSAQIEVSQGV